VNPLRPIHVVDELPNLRQRIWEVAVLRQVDLLFLDRPDHTLGIAVLSWFAGRRHTDLDPRRLQGLGILGGRILNPLVTVVQDRCVVREGPLQGAQGQGLVQRTTELPAPNVPGKHIHNNRQIDELCS